MCLSKECLPLSAFKGLIVLQKVLDTAAERNWLVTSVNVETMTEASFLKVFQDLDKRKEGQIIIDCELERLSSILKKVISHFLLLVSCSRKRDISPTLVICWSGLLSYLLKWTLKKKRIIATSNMPLCCSFMWPIACITKLLNSTNKGLSFKELKYKFNFLNYFIYLFL